MQIDRTQSINSTPAHRAAADADAISKTMHAGSWARPAASDATATADTKKSRHASSDVQFGKLKLGEKFFRDQFVDIHDVPEKHATLVVKTGQGPLKWDIEDWNKMTKAGFPMANILSLGKFGKDDGVMLQKVKHAGDPLSAIPWDKEITPYGKKLIASANEKTLKSLVQLRNAMKESEIDPVAMKVGFTPTGEVRVLSCGGIFEPGFGPGNKHSIEQLDRLIGETRRKLDAGSPAA